MSGVKLVNSWNKMGTIANKYGLGEKVKITPKKIRNEAGSGKTFMPYSEENFGNPNLLYNSKRFKAICNTALNL